MPGVVADAELTMEEWDDQRQKRVAEKLSIYGPGEEVKRGAAKKRLERSMGRRRRMELVRREVRREMAEEEQKKKDGEEK